MPSGPGKARPRAERYVGKVVRGPVWDRLLREYYAERVFVDITVRCAAIWPDLGAFGDMEVTGAAWPGSAGPQPPPENGTGPRVDVAKAAGLLAKFGLWQARRHGTAEHLQRLATEQAAGSAG